MEDQMAVAQAPPPLTFEELRALTLAELHALIEAKEKEKEAITETLGAMWQQRQQGTLPKDQYPDYLYYEDQLRVTLQYLDRLEPYRVCAEAEEKMTKAKAHHDRYCAPVAEQTRLVCQLWKEFVLACGVLARRIDTQISPLVVLTKPDNQPMYELDSGSVTVQNMFSLFPSLGAGLAGHVMPFLAEDSIPLTNGQAAAISAHVKGREPFSETNVQRYLAHYQIEEAKPMEEV